MQFGMYTKKSTGGFTPYNTLRKSFITLVRLLTIYYCQSVELSVPTHTPSNGLNVSNGLHVIEN